MIRLIGVLAVLTVWLAPSAQAREARLPTIPLPQPMPRIVEGECPGLDDAAGCYLGDVIYVGDIRDRFAKLHELGHAFDEAMLDPGERNRIARLMHKANLLWTWTDVDSEGRYVQGWGTPAEEFADAYANCRMRHMPGATVMQAGYDYYPTRRQHRLLCGVIARAGQDVGVPVSADGNR